MWTIQSGLLLSVCVLGSVSLDIEVVNQWSLLEFQPPYGYGARDFRPENTVFTGLEITPTRIFIATPRLRAGIPATLSTIPRNSPPGSSPRPQPYPDWSYHTVGLGSDNSTACSGLISVYRMRLDSCNRLWVLDSGIMTSIDDFQRICPPKLVVFDLRNDRVVRTVVFPREVLRPASLLANLIIDESVQGTCDSAFVYMADTAAPAILVYDAIRDTAWRVSHPSMFPDPDFATYSIGGETFTLPDGVVGLAHSPKLATVFFQPLATDRIFSIPTATLTKGPPAEFEDIPVALAGRKSSQGLGLAMNLQDDSLYFSPVTETSIASWNPITNRQSLLAYDPELLQFCSELRWKEDGIWLLSTRFQKYFKRTVSPNEVNLRVIRIPLSNRIVNALNNNLYCDYSRLQSFSFPVMHSRKLVFVLVVYGLSIVPVLAGSRDYARLFMKDYNSVRRENKSSRTWLCLVLGICWTNPPSRIVAETPPLNQIFQWKQLEFDYTNPTDRERDIRNGVFAVGEIAPIDVDVYYSASTINNHIFITIPRFRSGIPATLGTISNKVLDGNPIIKPYPSWPWHQDSRECRSDRIVSVFRVKIDECDRLWVLDTGKIGDRQMCKPQILAFDLKTDEVAHRHEFDSTVVTPISILVTPAVDVRNIHAGCKDTFVYIADVTGFAIIVYDVRNDKSWKIQDKTMYPYPSYGTYDIEGDSFELMDGILGLALSPYRPGEDRILFYHAMSSPTENWVFTSHLRNQSLFEEDPSSSPQIFNTYSKERKTQSAAEDIERSGIMFFGLIGNSQIACWNIQTDYDPKYFDIVASNRVTLQFPSGLKVITNKKGVQELWVLSSRFQKLANGSLKPNETNFRIQAGKVSDLLYGTKCKGKHNLVKPPHANGGGYGLYGSTG
ncbi:uncharacterized protein LOC132700084 [Cylas formicarius]|uniref:uncharacterized protein LOC132700084 n=1 Tax=Cylas formicarius TaxID=197179 RepID=UPI002958D93F|nr:uncharacterized protein LOC132700084 [Cylas formicarius]